MYYSQDHRSTSYIDLLLYQIHGTNPLQYLEKQSELQDVSIDMIIRQRLSKAKFNSDKVVYCNWSKDSDCKYQVLIQYVNNGLEAILESIK